MGSDIEIKDIKSLVLFDGVCKFCNSSINFIIKYEKGSDLKFATLQSSLSKDLSSIYGYDKNELNTLYLIENNRIYSKSEAIFHLASYLKFPWKLLSVFKVLPVGITDIVYEFVSKNRYKIFGKEDFCIVPDPELRSRFLD